MAVSLLCSSAPQLMLRRRATIWQVLDSPIPRLQAPLLFRKVRLQHAEEGVAVGPEEALVEPRVAAAPVGAEPLKLQVQRHKPGNNRHNRPAREAVRLRRISRLIAGFSWFSSLLRTP